MRIMDGVEEATWWDVARQCDYATFFHTPLWHRLGTRAVEGSRDISFSAVLPDGTRAVVPLLKLPTRYLRLFGEAVSTFAGCYGGPIADRPLAPGDRSRLYAAADRVLGRTVLNGNPLAEGREQRPRGFDEVADTTHLLRLDAPFDEIFSRFSKGHKASTKQGRGAGVVTRVGTSSEDYRRYFALYEAALERWGEDTTSRYPWSLFDESQGLAARHPDEIRLWLGERSGTVVSGALVFYWNRHAVYWHGASNDEGRDVSATNVVLADVIKDACVRGLEWFDLNPSGGHEGVAAFKRRFGAEEVGFPRYRRAHAPARLAHSLGRLTARFRR